MAASLIEMHSEAPLKALHAESPLRVWSLIVTIFGDVVMKQGITEEPEPIWNGALLNLLNMLRIEPGLARTSLSRLVANHTLIRVKSGRNTFYQLGSNSRHDFKIAAQRIYGRETREPTGRFHIGIIDPCDDRTKTREKLTAQGYRFIGATVAIKPIHKDGAVDVLPTPIISSIVEPSKSLSSAAQDAWRIEKLNEGYKHFLALFPPVVKPSDLSSADAMMNRVLLVHQFRRLILRDPNLPQDAMPKDWKGFEAQSRFLTNLDRLSVASEKWVTETGFLSGKPHDDPR